MFLKKLNFATRQPFKCIKSQVVLQRFGVFLMIEDLQQIIITEGDVFKVFPDKF